MERIERIERIESIMKNIEIIGGGTVSHVRNHLALCAPAYGTTARQIMEIIDDGNDYGNNHGFKINLHLTKMAWHGKGNLETNEDVLLLVDKLIANPETKIIFFNPALVDYEGTIRGSNKLEPFNTFIPLTKSGKYEARLKTSEGQQ